MVPTYRQRFEKAEAEYVEAKLEMHKTADVKEQLTEHLMVGNSASFHRLLSVSCRLQTGGDSRVFV
jgi:hypothetical protein